MIKHNHGKCKLHKADDIFRRDKVGDQVGSSGVRYTGRMPVQRSARDVIGEGV